MDFFNFFSWEMKRKSPYCKWKKKKKRQACFWPAKKSFPILICIFIMKVRSLPLGLVLEMSTRQFFMLYYFWTLNQILILFTWGFIFQSSEIIFILQFFSFFNSSDFFFLITFWASLFLIMLPILTTHHLT